MKRTTHLEQAYSFGQMANVQQQSYVQWLVNKKGFSYLNVFDATQNENLIQEFVTLMRYVAHQLAKPKGAQITMDQASQVVCSPGAGFDFMITPELPLYGHLFHYVAVNGAGLNKPVLESLVKDYSSAGMNINAPDENGQTPMMFALEYNSIGLIFTLAEHGVDLEACDNSGFTPLHRIMHYIRIGQMDISALNMWIEAGYKTDIKDSFGKTIVDHLQYHSDEPISLSMLEILGVQPESDNKVNEELEHTQELSPLHQAVVDGNYDSAIAISISIDGGLDSDGCSILHYAANYNKVDLIELLANLEVIDFNLKAGNGALPITIALVNANLELAEAFIKGGADINYQAENGDTLLHALAGAGMFESVKVALLCGAQADLISSQGRTPAHEFLYNDAKESTPAKVLDMLKILCKNKSFEILTHKDSEGKSVIDLVEALGKDFTAVVEEVLIMQIQALSLKDNPVIDSPVIHEHNEYKDDDSTVKLTGNGDLQENPDDFF